MTKVDTINFKSLFEHLPQAYIVFQNDDPDFTIIAENQAHAAMAGVVTKDIIGRPLFEVFPDVSEKYRKTGVSDLIESLRKVYKTGEPDAMPVLHYAIPSPDGTFTEKYWRVSHHPIINDKGQVTAIYQITQDITAERGAQTSLKKAQRQLNEALSSGLIGTWLWDVGADQVIGDKYMAAMFGVTESEASKGLPIDQFLAAIHPDDVPSIQKDIKNALKTGAIFVAEYRTCRGDGTTRWVLARGRIERDEHGKPVQFPGVLVDITDRKMVETNLSFLAKAGEVLSQSLDYTKTLKSIARLAVPQIADWCTIDILDEAGELQQVALAHKDPAKVKWAVELRKQQGPRDLTDDSSIAKVLRSGQPEFYPKITDDLIIASAKSEEELQLLRSLGLSSAITVPLIVNKKTIGALTLISAEQKRRYMQSDLNMAQELARRASLAITNAGLYENAQREIAARARLEEELRIANEQLERRVEERTAALEESNLSLQRSNQELQDFAYVASHDLQEPLRKIQAFGNLLQEEYSAKLGDGSDYLDRMRSAAARMSALIEDILSFSRVTTKARGYTQVDLSVVVKEVMGDLETRIEDTGARIEVGRLPTIHADAMQMRQLFQNLLGNAIKFHKQGVPPVIKISVQTDISQNPRKKYCTVLVEDNGVGFDEKYLNRIFAVFQRLHSRDSYEGTGIGLAVCRKIVERHGGTISASSKPGNGATFKVALPVHHKKGETL